MSLTVAARLKRAAFASLALLATSDVPSAVLTPDAPADADAPGC